MAEESVYKYIELTGVSGKSWEQAMNNAITKAAKSLRDLRVAEVITQDVRIDDNKVVEYRIRMKLSFKYEKEQNINKVREVANATSLLIFLNLQSVIKC